MGYLANRTTYLIGNIHNTVENDRGVGWRDDLTPILEQRYQLQILNPCKTNLLGVGECNVSKDQNYFHQLIHEKKYYQVKDEFWKIIRKDLRAVEKADFMIFYHNPTLPTVGSIHEVVNAYNQKKPVLIWCDEDKTEYLNPWLLTMIRHTWLFTNKDELLKYLDKVDKNELDSSWWW